MHVTLTQVLIQQTVRVSHCRWIDGAAMDCWKISRYELDWGGIDLVSIREITRMSDKERGDIVIIVKSVNDL